MGTWHYGFLGVFQEGRVDIHLFSLNWSSTQPAVLDFSLCTRHSARLQAHKKFSKPSPALLSANYNLSSSPSQIYAPSLFSTSQVPISPSYIVYQLYLPVFLQSLKFSLSTYVLTNIIHTCKSSPPQIQISFNSYTQYPWLTVTLIISHFSSELLVKPPTGSPSLQVGTSTHLPIWLPTYLTLWAHSAALLKHLKTAFWHPDIWESK